MNSVVETLNQWGSRFADFALPMLVQSSLFIILLFALDLVLRNRVRAALRYGLWILVLIKLILPPSFAAPTSLAYWLPQKKAVKTSPASSPQFVVHYSDVKFDEARPLPSLPPPHAELRLAGWLLLGWLATALGLIAWLVRRSRSIIQTASQALPASDSPEHLLDACRQQMGIRQHVRLKFSATASSPAVCGLWRPVILIPQQLADKLSALQLRAVLLHELAHIRRGDVWVHYAQTLLQIFYWWHPLLWLANAQIRRVREQAVDETVVVAMGSEAEVYPATLLEVARLAFKRPMLALGLIGIVESKSALAQRIQHLLDRPIPKSARLGFAGLVTVFLTGAALLPMARGQRTAQVDTRNVRSSSSGQTAAVTLTAKFIEISEADLSSLGLGEPTLTGTNGHRSWTLSPAQLNDLLQRALSQTTADVLSVPRVTTLSGRQAQIQVVDIVPFEGNEVRVGPSCDLIPYVNGGLIDLTIIASVTERRPVDPTAPFTSIADAFLVNDAATASATVGDQGGVVLQNPDARSSRGNRFLVVVSPAILAGDHAAGVQIPNQASTAAPGAASHKQEASTATVQDTSQTPTTNSEKAQPTGAATNGNAPKVEGEQLTVTITRSGHLYLGSESVTLAELETRLQRAASRNPAVTVSLRADTDAPFGEIVKVMDAAKEAGIKLISAFTGAQPPKSLKSQLTNTVTSSEGQGATKRFALSTGQEVEIEAIKPGEIQYYPETGIYVVTNDFVIRFKDTVLTAQRGQINTRTGEVIAERGVTLKLRDQVLSGERLQYNYIHQKINNTPEVEREELTVTIDKPGNLYLGSKRVTFEELKMKLEREASRNPAVTPSVRADKEAPFSEVVKVMDAAKETGIKSVKAFTRSRRDKVPVLGDLPYFGPYNLELPGIQSKLDQIILPQVVFDNMRLPDVLQWLSKQAREHDPEGKGINFVINPNFIETTQTAIMVPTTIDPLTGKLITLSPPAPADMNSVIVNINPPLRNVRLTDAVEAVVKTANKPIQYTVEDYGAIFSPKPSEARQLETRVFHLNGHQFVQNLREQMVGDVSTNVVDLVRSFFQGVGLSVLPPNAVFYNDRRGLLMIRATAKEMGIVQNTLELLNYAPPQITIEARFVEVGGNDAGQLGFDWLSGNLALTNGDPLWRTAPMSNGVYERVAVLTASQAQIIFKAMEQRRGTDVLSAPKVTTLSGRQAQISVTQATSVKGNAVYVGPALEVLPFVSDDGITLSVDASATVTDVFGNQADGHVRTRKVQGKAVVYDGQTLVLGNPTALVISRQPDGQSVTNAVPEDSGKRLLVFITATIIDPAGNPVHAGDNLPFDPNSVPPQSSR